MRRRPALITVALAALAAAAVVGAVVVVGSPATTSAQERTVTVARGVIQSTVSGSGNLEPANQADVDFATSGEITHIYVKAGQHVPATSCWRGSTPTPPTWRSPRPRRACSRRRTRSTRPRRRPDPEHRDARQRREQLGASSTSDSSSTSTMTVAAAQANLDSAQLSVTSAEKDLAATTLRAPMAGTVTAVNGAVGTTVSGGGSSSSSSSSSSSGSGGATVDRRPRRLGGAARALGLLRELELHHPRADQPLQDAGLPERVRHRLGQGRASPPPSPSTRRPARSSRPACRRSACSRRPPARARQQRGQLPGHADPRSDEQAA